MKVFYEVLGFILLFVFLASHDGCTGSGLSVTVDGTKHTLVWK